MGSSKSASEILRISRSKGTAPTHMLKHQADRLLRISKYASRGGGVLLATASLGVACSDIAHTDNIQEKNEILVETVGGIFTGTLYGVVTGAMIFIAATPVGWVAALVIGVGGVAWSYLGGKLAKNIYSIHGNKIDLVSGLLVGGVCK